MTLSTQSGHWHLKLLCRTTWPPLPECLRSGNKALALGFLRADAPRA